MTPSFPTLLSPTKVGNGQLSLGCFGSSLSLEGVPSLLAWSEFLNSNTMSKRVVLRKTADQPLVVFMYVKNRKVVRSVLFFLCGNPKQERQKGNNNFNCLKLVLIIDRPALRLP